MKDRDAVLECPELCAQVGKSPETQGQKALYADGVFQWEKPPHTNLPVPVPAVATSLSEEQLANLHNVISQDHTAGRSAHNARSKRIVAWYADRAPETAAIRAVLIQTQNSRRLFADWQDHKRPLYERVMEWLAS